MKNLEEMQNEALIRIVDDDADLRKGLTFMLECAGWKSAAYRG
jgi:FixJ family two-component response regulator